MFINSHAGGWSLEKNRFYAKVYAYLRLFLVKNSDKGPNIAN